MLSTFDQFGVRQDYDEICEELRRLQDSRRMTKLERCLLERTPGGPTRPPLETLAAANKTEVFVATVGVRGFTGKHRNILVNDVHRFGLKFIFADHLWLAYDRHWERLEPFLQGLKVVLVGTAIEYTRKDGTSDYGLALSKVTRLWDMASQTTDPVGPGNHARAETQPKG